MMGYKFTFCEGCEYTRNCDNCQKLCELEKAEKEGRLVVLPFLPNQEVWDYSEFFDGTPYAEYYKLRDSFIGIGVSANGKRTFEYDCVTIYPEQIGKTVFLTREEAEAALKGGEE